MSIMLWLLGAPLVERESISVALPAKAVALLGYLAATHTPQTRDHLLATLWPESSGEAGRKNLRNVLWAIRRELGTDLLHATDERLALTETTEVDLWRFIDYAQSSPEMLLTHQEAVLGLYRGPLLDGLSLLDAPEFELWLTMERERLGQLWMRVLSTLIQARRSTADWGQVLSIARHALSHDPLAESFYLLVMEAHARLGQRAEALRQYDVLLTLLDRELGVEPLPATTALRQQILNNALEPVVSGPAPAADSSGLPIVRKPAPPNTMPFVGREAEKALLDAALQTAAAGSLRVVILSGEIGIGKSRLWAEWSSKLGADYTILAMQCLESTQALPFAPLTDLFNNRLCTKTLFHVNSPIAPMWLAEVARLMPQLRTTLPHLPVPPVLPADEERRRIFEAFAQSLQALIGPPLVLGIDDLHWADRTTSDWLDYLVHRLANVPLLLVVTYRPEEASAATHRMVSRWMREGIASNVGLERLSMDEAARLLGQLGRDPAQAEELQIQSAGNPLFLVELSRTSDPVVPPLLADLIQARLERLPEATLQIIQAAAVLEPAFTFATLRDTCGRPDEATLDGLDALLAAGFLNEKGDIYTFAHPLVATVVYTRLSNARRTFLHRRAAHVLEQAHAGHLKPIAGRLVAHYRLAAQGEKAATYADMAAEHALSLAAPAEAAAFYSQAINLAPIPTRYRGLGQAQLWQGDLPAARRAFETALEGFEAIGDWRNVVEVCLCLAETYLPAGRPEVSIEWAERALHTLSKLDPADRTLEANVRFMLGTSQRYAGHPLHIAEAHLQQVIQQARTYNLADLMARCQFELGNILAQKGELQTALTVFADSIERAEAVGNHFQAVLACNNAAYNAVLAGEINLAHEFIARGLALAETWALRLPLQYLYSTRGEIALSESKWDDATRWFERGLREAASHDNAAQVANYRANLGLAARGRSDLATALTLLRTAATEAALLTTPYLQTQIDLWLAETWHMHNDELAARTALARAQARLSDQESGWLSGWAAQVAQSLTQN